MDYAPVYEVFWKQRKEENRREAWDKAVAKATAWIQEHEPETDFSPPGLLENLSEFEQALMEAREFYSPRAGADGRRWAGCTSQRQARKPSARIWQ